ncbi:MAG TPA: proline dehydrogenase family protein, partial [Pyrinomonadaceae bacterium]
MSEYNLDFQDTATAFADKSDAELLEKYRMFKMMNSPLLSGLGTAAAEFALALGLPVKGLIKETLYKQFCGGETIEECQPTIEKLGRSRIGTILDYSIEGKSDEAVFEHTKAEIYRTITRAREDDYVPFAVFKVTGLVRFEVLEKVSAGAQLLKSDADEWTKGKQRVFELCEYAHSIKQSVFIDAEESWIQDAIDDLATEMMEKFNRETPIIYNTIQLYRRDRLEFLRKSHRAALENGYIYAAKLVRGAYMEKERDRAAELGYPSPIQPSKEAADRDFNAAVEYCLDNIETVSFVAGTHNEQSTRFMTE